MAKRKPSQTPPKPWEAPVSDVRAAGHFGKVYTSLLQCENFKSLSLNARYLYLVMIASTPGEREFSLTKGQAEKAGLKGGSFRRGLNELIKAGFVTIKQSGHRQRKPTIYEFVPFWRG